MVGLRWQFMGSDGEVGGPQSIFRSLYCMVVEGLRKAVRSLEVIDLWWVTYGWFFVVGTRLGAGFDRDLTIPLAVRPLGRRGAKSE